MQRSAAQDGSTTTRRAEIRCYPFDGTFGSCVVIESVRAGLCLDGPPSPRGGTGSCSGWLDGARRASILLSWQH